MARMHPETIAFTRSDAEVRVFRALAEALPDEYDVLHHVRWVQRREEGGARDGEADFLIVHPNHGVLVVEVKGGQLRYDASRGAWLRNDGSIADDPVDQVRDARYSIERYLRRLSDWSRTWGPFGYALVFPDGELDGPPLPHLPGDIVLGSRDLLDRARLREGIERAFAYWAARDKHLGTTGAARVVRAFAHDLEIRQPLGVAAKEADREIVRLTESQYRVLHHLAGVRRAAIAGPAGSGKTLLALEKAKRLAADEFHTLLCCFNRPLADYLRDSASGVPNLDVMTFHQLCMSVAIRAGIAIPRSDGDQPNWDALVGALMAAPGLLESPYDAMVVDEGQDFAPDWWLLLLSFLRDSDHGLVYVFYDSNQRIYRRPLELPADLTPVSLNEVIRNTKQIFEVTKPCYLGTLPVCLGPDGPPVEWRRVAKDRLRQELSRVLHHLVDEEKVAASDIVVLTPVAVDKCGLQGRCGRFQLTPTPQSSHDVYLSTIHRFKGLDRLAVVVAGVPWVDEDVVAEEILSTVGADRVGHVLELADSPDASDAALRATLGEATYRAVAAILQRRLEQSQLMYVACSRARTLLTVLVVE